MTATILVVDDLHQNVELLRVKLEAEYYTVITTCNPKDGLTLLSEHKIDVIILDVMMPEMDGFEFCKIVKNDPATTHIPVVMVTALSDHEDKICGLESGADDFLTKPINDIALLSRVRFLSKMKQAIDELKMRNQTNMEMGITVNNIGDQIDDVSIIVIDDDVVQFRNIYNTLKKSDICRAANIMHANSSEEINFLDDPIDIVIISTQLEKEDCLRIFVNLKTKPSFNYSSFILLAHEEDFSILSKGFDVGVSDYLLSPINRSELIARIRTQIKRKKYYDALRTSITTQINMSVKDNMTNLYNKTYFDYHLNNILRDFHSSKKLFCLMMIDIDDFKHVNDSYGHQAGDKVLQEVARIIRSQVRVVDLVARYGGEEFLVLLKNADLDMGIIIAERIRKSIEDYVFIMPSSVKFRKTISAGLAKYHEGDNSDALIKRADSALYKSKFNGKNQIHYVK